jgi:hypothetical protein
VDTISEGKPYLFQLAMFASVVINLMGSILLLHGILLSDKYLVKSVFDSCSLIYLLKGPVYEINAEAIKTSPTNNSNDSPISVMEFPHLSFSDPKALTNL